MNIFNVGIIGAGIIARSHLEAAVKILDVRIKCISDVAFERAQAFAKEFNITPYRDYREMLKNEELDIVIIALPVFLHREAVLEAVTKKIHVLTEKPMASNVDECRDMIDAAKKYSIKLMVGHIQRYLPENIRAYEIMKSGILGKLIMINDKRYYNYFTPERPLWCLKKETAGGGVMLNIGAHSIDKVLFMSESTVKKAIGKFGFFKGQYDVEGNGQIFLEMENGISAVITHTGYNSESESMTEYLFTNGMIKVALPARITVLSNEKKWEEEIKPIDPFELQLRNLVNSIKSGKEPEISGEYGYEVIRIITGIDPVPDS